MTISTTATSSTRRVFPRHHQVKAFAHYNNNNNNSKTFIFCIFLKFMMMMMIINKATCWPFFGDSNDNIMDEDDVNKQFVNCSPNGQIGPILDFEKQWEDIQAATPETSSSSSSSSNAILSSLQQSWLPAYPGSGSGLIGVLIENATGFNRSTPKTYCGLENSITCKTHYPSVGKESPDDIKHEVHIPFSGKYFMLIRNPAGAIPSYYNQIHEIRTDVGSHTQQAPVDDWRIWRDQEFHRMIHLWTRMIKYWDGLTQYKLEMYIPYEELIEPKTGPALFRDFLDNLWILHEKGDDRKSSNFGDDDDGNVANEVACLWKTFVIDNASVKRSKSYEPGFTLEQRDHMLNVLSNLIEWALEKTNVDNNNDPKTISSSAIAISNQLNKRLVDILVGYRKSIYKNLIIDDWE